MPQLDPAPWFMILVFSWLVLLIVIPPKVTAHTLPNEPALQNTSSPKTEAWPWSWHQAYSTSL